MEVQTFVFSEELLSKDRELRTIDKNTDEYSKYALEQMGFELNLSLHYKKQERDYQIWSHPNGMFVFLLLSETNSVLPGKKRIDDFRFVMFGEKKVGDGLVILKTEKFGDNIMVDESAAPHCVNLYTVKDQGCNIDHDKPVKFPSFVSFVMRNKSAFESIKNNGIPNDLLSAQLLEWLPDFLYKKAALKIHSSSKSLELEFKKVFQQDKQKESGYLIPGDLEWGTGNAKGLINKMLLGNGRTEITMADREEIQNFFKDLQFVHTFDELKPFMSGKTAGVDNGLFVFMILLQSPAARSTIWRQLCESISPEEYFHIMDQPCAEPGASWSLYFLSQKNEIKGLSDTKEFREYAGMVKRCFDPRLKFDSEILNVSGLVFEKILDDVKNVPGPHASPSFFIAENLSKNEVFLDLLQFLEEKKKFNFYDPIKRGNVADKMVQLQEEILEEFNLRKTEVPAFHAEDNPSSDIGLMSSEMIGNYVKITRLFGSHGAPAMYDFMQRKKLQDLLLVDIKKVEQPQVVKKLSNLHEISRF